MTQLWANELAFNDNYYLFGCRPNVTIVSKEVIISVRLSITLISVVTFEWHYNAD